MTASALIQIGLFFAVLLLLVKPLGGYMSGGNLGPINPALDQAVRNRIEQLRNADPTAMLPVPVDLVTASGSGLDPDISPAAALYQAPRVAAARRVSLTQITDLIKQYASAKTLGLLGEPRVNVLRLNLALDRLTRSLVSKGLE